MNKLDKDYCNLLQYILDNGVKKEDRTGTGTISIFGRQIRHKMSEGFPLLTTKKMAWKQIVTELLWFLKGDTNIKYLVDNGCHVWDGDCFANYVRNFTKYVDSLPENSETEFIIDKDKFINKIKTDDEFARKWGELGPIYGKQWRRWNNYIGDEIAPNGFEMWNEPIDQIANLINDLKTNPDSRRLMVNAWNVGELDGMVLPPCHYGFQVYTRELSLEERREVSPNSKTTDMFKDLAIDFNPDVKMGCWNDQMSLEDFNDDIKKEIHINYDKENIPRRAISLMWNQRSVDTFLGLPFNIASYGLLLEIIAKAVNMVPDELIGNLGDVHLYSNHIEQAKEQIGKELTARERTALGSNGSTALYDSIKEENYETIDADDVMHTVCDDRGVIRHTREPYPLPTLKINSGNENWHLLTVDEIINSLDVDITFKVDGYKSHPTIKAPLSN